MKEVVLEKGYSLNKILPTKFALRHEGKIVGVMSSNVNVLVHGELPGFEKQMKDILDVFRIREEQECNFRFCGKEVQQDENFNITVTAKDNTEKIRPITIDGKRRRTDKCRPGETTALRSVVTS